MMNWILVLKATSPLLLSQRERRVEKLRSLKNPFRANRGFNQNETMGPGIESYGATTVESEFSHCCTFPPPPN